MKEKLRNYTREDTMDNHYMNNGDHTQPQGNRNGNNMFTGGNPTEAAYGQGNAANGQMEAAYGQENAANSQMEAAYGRENAWYEQNHGNPGQNYGYGNSNQGYQDPNQNYAYGQFGGYPDVNGGYQYAQQGGYEQELEAPVTLGEWVVAFLLLLIPCVGIVMVFVWAFSSTEKKSKSNFFKALLIMIGVLIALFIVFLMSISIIIAAI